MSIKNQEILSQLSPKTETGGAPMIDSINSSDNKKIYDNYSNLSIATAARGEVIKQVTPAKKSTLAPKTNIAGDDSYTAVTYNNNLV
jgi:hypothetical protein